MRLDEILDATAEQLEAELLAAGWPLTGGETHDDNRHNMAVELSYHGKHTYYAAFMGRWGVTTKKIKADSPEEAAEKLARMDRLAIAESDYNEAVELGFDPEELDDRGFIVAMERSGYRVSKVTPDANNWYIWEPVQ